MKLQQFLLFIIVIVNIIQRRLINPEKASNEYIYYCRTAKKYNETEFNVVPLEYTNKDSEEREEEYYRVVLTHCLFLHIAPVSIYSYCALSSL